MPTLVIHAPRWKAQQENAQSFERTFNSGIGEGYAIYRNLFANLFPGCGVVLLSKDEKRRAEGTLIRLVPTEMTNNGIQRYDVHIRNLIEVEYRPERLNHCGVAVIL